jgi:hypothetical protein
MTPKQRQSRRYRHVRFHLSYHQHQTLPSRSPLGSSSPVMPVATISCVPNNVVLHPSFFTKTVPEFISFSIAVAPASLRASQRMDHLLKLSPVAVATLASRVAHLKYEEALSHTLNAKKDVHSGGKARLLGLRCRVSLLVVGRTSSTQWVEGVTFAAALLGSVGITGTGIR